MAARSTWGSIRSRYSADLGRYGQIGRTVSPIGHRIEHLWISLANKRDGDILTDYHSRSGRSDLAKCIVKTLWERSNPLLQLFCDHCHGTNWPEETGA